MKKILVVLTLYVFSFVSVSAIGIEGDRPIKNEDMNLTIGVNESRAPDMERYKKIPHIRQFLEYLEQAGFHVGEGKFEKANIYMAYEIGSIPSCYCINASAPAKIIKTALKFLFVRGFGESI